jgi:hypothetical protein
MDTLETYHPAKTEANQQAGLLVAAADPLCPTTRGKRPTLFSPAHSKAEDEKWTPELGQRKGTPGARESASLKPVRRPTSIMQRQPKEESTLGWGSGLPDLQSTSHGDAPMEHAKVAGVRGVHVLGTPIPLEDIWDTAVMVSPSTRSATAISSSMARASRSAGHPATHHQGVP